MDPTKPTTGTDKPTKKPAEPKTDDIDDAPSTSIKTFQNLKVSKPGTDSARKAANPSNTQPTATRESTASPENPSIPAARRGHKKTNSGDSTTSSMRVATPDRDNESEREHPSELEQPRARERKQDMKGIGDVFQPRASP